MNADVLTDHLCAWIVVISVQGSTTLRRYKIIRGIDTNVWLFEVSIALDVDTHAPTLSCHYKTALAV